MRVALYNLFIRAYQAGAAFLSLFNPKAKSFTKGRQRLLTQIKNDFQGNDQPIAWFHCASLGEFEQGKPVLEAFKALHQNHKILVTFFSPSGYEQRKDYSEADHVYYLPLDTPTNAKTFLDLVNPAVAFFIKYEFWYHFLKELHDRKVALYNISGLFTPNHPFFKRSASLQRKMLDFFDHFFVQDERSKELLEGINITNVTVSGDTRFDRVLETVKTPNSYPIVEHFKADRKLVIIGSSWPEDMAVLYDFINKSDDGVKFLIAPHLVDEAHVHELEKGLRVSSVRYATAKKETVDQAKVLIVNSIGLLSSLYQYGEVAYIGGAFTSGVHNILEAVAFGLPVIFGNKDLDKFPETGELMALGGAFSVANQVETSSTINKLLTDPSALERSSEICKKYVSDKAGATEIIINHVR